MILRCGTMSNYSQFFKTALEDALIVIELLPMRSDLTKNKQHNTPNIGYALSRSLTKLHL